MVINFAEIRQVNRAELFKRDMKQAIQSAISRLDKGTVGIGADCLWQMTVTHIKSAYGPTGTNAGWAARQTFNEVIAQSPWSKFVY